MNIEKLKSKIIENELSISETAHLMGIDKSSLYRKLKNHDTVTIGEADKLKRILNLTDWEALEIFLR